ncbi:CPBP family glutamic-type intramembrane protease [Nocardiopsis xinjiangensis]|uniref:CPBP family glutamic-type intramembrane protease n=1 Tax=Nocardiopsis xinjiangensis TaxID=124285 RepID=UPI00034D8090|nr:CPBP family glutamic-type intramembrane protease [Nocardiopsis xinjiangensis]
MTALLALMHLAVPWVLRYPPPLGTAVRFAGQRPEGLYTVATVALGSVALLAAGSGPPGLVTAWTHLACVVAVVLGCAFPLVMGGLVSRPRRFVRLPRRPVWTGLCTASEEALWRLAALGGLVHAGTPVLLAAMSTMAGFALLHVPRNGWRVIPYQLLLGAALTGLALLGGVLAAALFHYVHNLVMSATARVSRRRAPAAPPDLPPSRSWDG